MRRAEVVDVNLVNERDRRAAIICGACELCRMGKAATGPTHLSVLRVELRVGLAHGEIAGRSPAEGEHSIRVRCAVSRVRPTKDDWRRAERDVFCRKGRAVARGREGNGLAGHNAEHF